MSGKLFIIVQILCIFSLGSNASPIYVFESPDSTSYILSGEVPENYDPVKMIDFRLQVYWTVLPGNIVRINPIRSHISKGLKSASTPTAAFVFSGDAVFIIQFDGSRPTSAALITSGKTVHYKPSQLSVAEVLAKTQSHPTQLDSVPMIDALLLDTYQKDSCGDVLSLPIPRKS